MKVKKDFQYKCIFLCYLKFMRNLEYVCTSLQSCVCVCVSLQLCVYVSLQLCVCVCASLLLLSRQELLIRGLKTLVCIVDKKRACTHKLIDAHKRTYKLMYIYKHTNKHITYIHMHTRKSMHLHSCTYINTQINILRTYTCTLLSLCTYIHVHI